MMKIAGSAITTHGNAGAAAVVVVTDGLNNRMNSLAERARLSLDRAVAPRFAAGAVGLYAITVGDLADADYFDSLCADRGAHVNVSNDGSPFAISRAFDATFGEILQARDDFYVVCEMRTSTNDSSYRKARFGLVTPASHEAKLIEVPLPERLELDDTIDCCVTVGRSPRMDTNQIVAADHTSTWPTSAFHDIDLAIRAEASQRASAFNGRKRKRYEPSAVVPMRWAGPDEW
jgi:hypothetical protein